MNFDDQLNATGALCPIPVLKAQKRLKKSLLLLTSEPHRDTIHYNQLGNHRRFKTCLDYYKKWIVTQTN